MGCYNRGKKANSQTGKGVLIVFDADRPILKKDQDRLNRAQFAKCLARCLLDYNETGSLVIGLQGGFGSGKTSIINLVVEELNFAGSNMLDENKPIILNFSAWSYSGQNQLIYNFFRRLSATLRSIPNLENGERIIQLLELYVSFFTQKPIPRSLRKKKHWWQRSSHYEDDTFYAWESGRDLTLVKAELNELLNKQHHKIIIIIDNISRLFDYEIKQIFQIVKSMGDYANTVYLLSYDKHQIIKAINKIDDGTGDKYLEKIVQLPFDVPPILQQDLENIFADRISDVIANVTEETWDIEYWADLYYNSLKYFFKNCRDITRYVNILSFGYSRLRDLVNPVDFFALTALSVFTPSIYFGVRDNKDLFTDLLDNVYPLDKDQIAKDKLRIEEIIKRDHHVAHEIILALLMRLFPRLRHIYQPDTPFYYSIELARKLKRISSPDLFDLYFSLSMQSAQILSTEFETILHMTTNPEAFDHALTRLNQDGRIIKFLDLLDSHVIKTIPPEQIQPIINALLDNGDLFPEGISGMLSLNTPMRIHRIIHGLLQRLKTTQDRFISLQHAMAKATKSIYIIAHEMREQAREHDENVKTFMPEQYRDLTTEQLESLCQLTASEIENWAETGRLVDHPKLLPLLYAWRKWGSDGNCRKFVEVMTNTDRGLIAFLTAALNRPITQAMTEYERKTVWQKCLDDMAEFIQPKTLEAHAVLLFENDYFEKLREREQLALMIFLDLINAKTKKTIPKTTV